jgi:hypothetical protein
MSGINNSLAALRPELRRVYVATIALYKAKYPSGHNIAINETSRSEAVQDAYFARGRESVETVQALYKAAGLYPIGEDEAKEKNTNARYGESAHNFPLSAALDIRITDRAGNYVDSPSICRAFWILFEAEAKRQNVAVTWGGTWKDWPHIELTGWRHLPR